MDSGLDVICTPILRFFGKSPACYIRGANATLTPVVLKPEKEEQEQTQYRAARR
jgi:hypothetical protein